MNLRLVGASRKSHNFSLPLSVATLWKKWLNRNTYDERDRAETLEWTGESSGNLKWYHFHAIMDLVPIIMLQFSVGVTRRSVILCRSTSSSLRLLTLRSLLPLMVPSRHSDLRFIEVHTGHWCRSLAEYEVSNITP